MENLPATVEPTHGLISRIKRKIVDVVAPEPSQPTAMVSYSKSKPPAGEPNRLSPVPINPSAMVSSTKRIEEQNERINVGSNLSQVQRAMRSQTFKPLPEGKTDYQKIVDKSLKDVEKPPKMWGSVFETGNVKDEVREIPGFSDEQRAQIEEGIKFWSSFKNTLKQTAKARRDGQLSYEEDALIRKEFEEFKRTKDEFERNFKNSGKYGDTSARRLISVMNDIEDLADREFKSPLITNHTENLRKKTGRPEKHWGDDTLNKIDRVVDAGVDVLAHPAKKIGYGARKKTDQAYADWQEKGKRDALAKKAYNETFAKRKADVNTDKQQQAIEKAKDDAKYHAETTFGERRLDDAQKVINVGIKAIPVVKTVAKAGFHGAKTGIRAFNELSDEIVKNPMLIKMGEHNEATLREMGAHAALARGSIRATGLGNKRQMSAGSLVTQHRLGTTNTATFNTAGASATNPYGITSRYEKGIGGRTELHYFVGNTRITHQQAARVLTTKQIHELKNVAKYNILGQQPVQYQAQAQAQRYQTPFAVAQSAPVLNVTNTHSGLMKKRVESVSCLAKKRIQGNPIGQGIRASAPFSAPVKRIVL